MTLIEQKARLRARVREARAQLCGELGPSARRERAGALVRAVNGLPWPPGTASVASFVGVGDEPDTSDLNLFLHRRGWAISLPRIDGPGDMAMFVVREHDELDIGVLRIPTPGPKAPAAGTLHVVFVPGLAFGNRGERLGQGGGYYDRFISQCSPRPLLIGVCHSEFVGVPEYLPPMADHDISVDWLVTESGLRKCRV